MPIANRDLPVGTRLVAKYKGVTFVAEKQADGYNVIEPAGHPACGKDYKSPSGAGSAAMGGTACNGWRFWSVEGEAPATAAEASKANGAPTAKAGKPKAQRKRARVSKFIRRADSQDELGEGEVRWWCSACLDHFVVLGNEEPSQCPNGHRLDDAELSATPPEAAAAGADA